MDRQEPVQVSFQLPPGSLEGFSRLVEQLRLLAAQLDGGGKTSPAVSSVREGMENPAFDWQRYYELGQGAPPPESVHAPCRDEALTPPEPAEDGLSCESDGAAPAAPPGGTVEHTPLEARAVQDRADSPPAETPLLDATAVWMEPESSIPEVESVWAAMETRDPDPAAVRAEAQAVMEPPQSAGFSIGTGPSDLQSRWGGITEELAVAGPAPLTAEAVSQAFQRDGRRYDNGFPLY